MSDNNPLVSVVVVNLNGEKVIERCLSHLLNQTYLNYEIIVVDNGSTDQSLQILNEYIGRGPLTVVSMPHNCGCAGGRNVGVQYARGEIIAFMDNDGYPHERWLQAVVDKFNEDDSIGAVASVVFFHNNKLVLNGAGGTINLQGYGGDYNFFEPYEFAVLPNYVLYPMGCGMAVRRHVIERSGPWDDSLPNYYDDTELGIRVWKLGFKVAVAAQAWVDHQFNYSSSFITNKAYLNECGRIRLVLKYYPLGGLMQWFLHDLAHILRNPLIASIYIRAWLWNMRRLPSAFGIRLKFNQKFVALDRFVQKSWGWFPMFFPPIIYRPQIDQLSASVDMSIDPNPSLVYGWYYVEMFEKPYRFSSSHASILIKASKPSNTLMLSIGSFSAVKKFRVIVRLWGELEPFFEFQGIVPNSVQWHEICWPCELPAGIYEILLLSEEAVFDGHRTLGLPVSFISVQ